MNGTLMGFVKRYAVYRVYMHALNTLVPGAYILHKFSGPLPISYIIDLSVIASSIQERS